MLHGQPRQLSMSGLLQKCPSCVIRTTENIFKTQSVKDHPALVTTHRPGDIERLDTAEGPTPATIARRTLNTAGASLYSCSICERMVCLY